jgi:hypothetical protein
VTQDAIAGLTRRMVADAAASGRSGPGWALGAISNFEVRRPTSEHERSPKEPIR